MISTIIKREFFALLKSKVHIISTAILCGLFLIAGVIGKIYFDKQGGVDEMALNIAKSYINAPVGDIGLSPELAELETVITTLNPAAKILTSPSQKDAAEEWLTAQGKDGSALATLVGNLENPVIIQYGDSNEANATSELIKAALKENAYQKLGAVEPQQLAILQGADQVVIHSVEGTISLVLENPAGYFSGYVTIILLLFAIMVGISSVMQGVVEEKSSRVVEILLSSVRPRTLLFGKIIGIGSFVVFQMTLYIVSVITALKISGLLDSFVLNAVNFPSLIGASFLWMILGFFVFATFGGALASTISRQEDLGGISGLITFFAIIPFYLAMFLVPNSPDGIVTKIVSYIPGFSSFLIPIRQSLATITTWEICIAIALNLIGLALLTLVSGKIYHNSVLQTGKRIPLLQALRGIK